MAKGLYQSRNDAGDRIRPGIHRAECRSLQHVLDTIDNRLMPSAKSEELKALLYKMFAPLSDHLEYAQQIQGSLNK